MSIQESDLDNAIALATYANHGRSLLEKGEVLPGLSMLSHAATAVSDNADMTSEVMRLAVENGHPEIAKELAVKFLGRRADIRVFYWLGRAEIELNNAKEALLAWQQVLFIDPSDQICLVDSALVLDSLGNADAFNTCVGVLKQSGLDGVRDNALAAERMVKLGRVVVAKNSIESSRFLLERAVQLSPENEQARALFAIVLEVCGAFVEYCQQMKWLIEHHPDRVGDRDRIKYINTLLDLGFSDLAAEELYQVAEIKSAIWNLLEARVAIELGVMDQALNSIQSAVRFWGEGSETSVLLTSSELVSLPHISSPEVRQAFRNLRIAARDVWPSLLFIKITSMDEVVQRGHRRVAPIGVLAASAEVYAQLCDHAKRSGIFDAVEVNGVTKRHYLIDQTLGVWISFTIDDSVADSPKAQSSDGRFTSSQVFDVLDLGSQAVEIDDKANGEFSVSQFSKQVGSELGQLVPLMIQSYLAGDNFSFVNHMAQLEKTNGGDQNG